MATEKKTDLRPDQERVEFLLGQPITGSGQITDGKGVPLNLESRTLTMLVKTSRADPDEDAVAEFFVVVTAAETGGYVFELSAAAQTQMVAGQDYIADMLVAPDGFRPLAYILFAQQPVTRGT